MIYFKCKFCGGNLTFSDSQKNITCEFCGTKQHFSSVDESDSIKLRNLLKRMYNFLEDQDYDQLVKYFNKVLDIDPENYEAYKINIFACIAKEFNNRKEPSSLYISTDLQTNENYQKMIKNVPSFSSQDFSKDLESFITNIQIKASFLEIKNIEGYIEDVEDESFGQYLIDVYVTQIKSIEDMLTIVNSEQLILLKNKLKSKLTTHEKELIDSKTLPDFLLGTYKYKVNNSTLKLIITNTELIMGNDRYNYGYFKNDTSYRVMINKGKRANNAIFVYNTKFSKYISDIIPLWIQPIDNKNARLVFNDGTYFDKE